VVHGVEGGNVDWLGDMIFRAAADSDAAAISELVLAFQDDYLLDPAGRGAEEFLTSVSAEAERGYLGSSRYYYLLGEAEGVLAGVIAVRDGTHIFRLFVARNFQRQGLARELWRRARQALGPVDQAMNFTVNSSVMAVPVYKRLGFEQTSPQLEAHGIAVVPMRLTEQQAV
jgi:GNAT superfamily N-acetyltransferase